VPRTRVVIQSRLNSSRLPGKAMLTIAGMPLIELVARRASRSSHEVVVATSQEQYDERIAAHLESVGIPVVRGSLDDVLGRFVQATADLDDDDRVVRLTGDNPLADADLVDELIAAVDATQHSYGRVDIDQVPEGLGAEVFRVGDLRRAAAKATEPYDREHVTPWLRRTLGELLFVPSGCPDDIHAYRATVDTLGDYVRVSSLFTGVEDPVGIGWLTLMRSLADDVDARGARVESRPTALGRLSGVMLSARDFDDPAVTHPAEHAEALRTLIAEAVDRGVTHVDVGRDDGRAEDLLRACAEPALVKRFELVSRTGRVDRPAPPSDTADALAVEATVERSFAALGRRTVAAIVFPDAEHAAYGWRRARDYREAGATRAIGLVADSVADLEWALGVRDVDYVEVGDGVPEAHPVLDELADRGVTLVARYAAQSQRPSWASALVVTSTSRADLDGAIAVANGSRSTIPT